MHGADSDASCGIVCGNAAPARVERLLLGLASSRPRLTIHVVGPPAQPQLTALAQRFGARYLEAPPLLGLAYARNQSLRAALAAGAAYHFLFTPDIALAPDAVGKLLGWMRAHPDVGLLAPRIHHPDGRLQPLCTLLPGPLDVLLRRLCPPLYRSSGRLARFELHEGGYRRPMEAPVLPGCCLLIRSAAVTRTGLFDEGLLCDFDTIDLARRVAVHARCVCVPHVGIVRHPSREDGQGWRHALSALRYFDKWGWWRDGERERINARALRALGVARRQRDPLARRRDVPG